MLNIPFLSFLHHLPVLNTPCPPAKHLKQPSHFGRKLFWKKNKGYSNIKPIKSALYIYTYFSVFLFLERKILKWRICRLLFMFFHNLMIVLKRKLPCHTTNFKNWPYMDINIIVTNDLNVCDLRRLSCLYALHFVLAPLYIVFFIKHTYMYFSTKKLTIFSRVLASPNRGERGICSCLE